MTAKATLALAIAAAVLSAGCGNASDEREASAAVTRLVEAVDRGDGARACEALTTEAAGALAEATGQTCETEIVKLELAHSGVADVTVAMTSAQVDLAGGHSFFLDDTSRGWKVSAAACEPRPSGPYDCEVEG